VLFRPRVGAPVGLGLAVLASLAAGQTETALAQGAAAFPPGFEPKPAPFNVSFTGTACSEPKLIELAYAFEQATKKRIPPPLFP